MFAAFLTTIFFSISVICGHRSAKIIGGSEANFWRLVFASVFLAFWAFIIGTGLSGTTFPLLFLSGALGIGVGDVALFQALPRLGPGLTMMLTRCLAPPFAALIEWLWLGTRLSGMQIFYGLVILLGIGIYLSPGKKPSSPAESNCSRHFILLSCRFWRRHRFTAWLSVAKLT